MDRCLLICSAVVIGAAHLARAQQTAPPVHPVGAFVAKTQEPIVRLVGIHVLSDGRVIVNDAFGRRVLLFDSTLAKVTALLDTTGATPRIYPAVPSGGPVIPYRGDSTVFFDARAIALVVLDPFGRVARVSAPPFPPDAWYLTFPGAGLDPAGRAVYKASISAAARPTASGYQVIAADSAPIVRATAGRVAPETLAYLRVAKIPAREPYVTKDGQSVRRPVIDPFVLLDEWAMLPDGTIAIIRGQDYHLDWVAPDGTRTSSPKLPFQWHRLSDSEKVVIIDSVKAYADAHPTRSFLANATPVTYPNGVIGADSLAAYRPPFRAGAMIADAEGNVWIQPTPEIPLSPNPGPVYDVISRPGKLIDRVQLSPGFAIVGFSPGYIFMTIREGSTTVLVKAKIR